MTLGNLFCGCMAIYFASTSYSIPAACLFIIIGGFLDFGDGLVARALKVKSELGAQLDSLADVVSFGVAPAFLVAHLIFDYEIGIADCISHPIDHLNDFLPAFFLVLFAAYRLAKFNIDTRQTDSFIGLPTPAMALFVVPIAYYFSEYDPRLLKLGKSFLWIIYANIALFSYLMVSELPMFALKFKGFGWKGNEIRYGFLAACVVLLAVFQIVGLSLCILLYIVLSIILKFAKA